MFQKSKSTIKNFRDSYYLGELNKFYQLAPRDYKGALQIEHLQTREALVKALSSYATDLQAPKVVFEKLEQLSHQKSSVVVTGQQVGLLLGPSYTLSKAISAIKLAQKLSSKQKPVLPIFWLASQDHDSAEINHSYLLDMSENLTRLAIPLPEGIPAGYIKLEREWLEHLTNQINSLNFPKIYREEVIDLLQNTANYTHNIADWFAALLYKLLGNQGLIIVNPLNKDIAILGKDILQKELKNPLASSKIINRAAEELRIQGIEPQLGRGEDASNLFITENNQRHLLHFNGKEFYSNLRSYSQNELLVILEQNPSLITPAAGLRPIMQDYILPTASMVVGPGELRYIAQLKGVYEMHGVAMPLMQPRMTVTFIEPPVKRILAKFNLTVKQLSKDFKGRREETVLQLSNYSEIFQSQLINLEKSLIEMLSSIDNIDPTLKPVIKRSHTRFNRTLENLKHKSSNALLKKDAQTKKQFDRLQVQLFPHDTAQERLLSPVSFFLKFGTDYVLKLFLELPFEGEHEINA